MEQLTPGSDPSSSVAPSTPERGGISRVLLAVATLLAVGAMAVAMNKDRLFGVSIPPPPPYKGPTGVKAGDRLVIIDPRTFVGADPDAVKAYQALFVDEDLDAMRDMVKAGRGFNSYIGAQVEVLEVLPDLCKIRLLPNSTQKDKEGYTLLKNLGATTREDVVVPPSIADIPIETRKEIYTTAKRGEITATWEARGKFDTPKPPAKESKAESLDRLQKRQTYFQTEREKAFKEAAAKYKITPEQLTYIMNEGFERSWPQPDVPDPYHAAK